MSLKTWLIYGLNQYFE